ncbi:MAG TPA: hypothetical protein VHG91_11805 [Longimicrobium sp.]|nr:hypothetical protein [Longimicrobium sp.]
MRFTVDELLAWAARHEGDEWVTLHRRRPFRYRVTPVGIEYVPATGIPRPISRKKLAVFCDQFQASGSFSPGAYRRNFTKSYSLALIKRFLESRGA